MTEHFIFLSQELAGVPLEEFLEESTYPTTRDMFPLDLADMLSEESSATDLQGLVQKPTSIPCKGDIWL